ncbi:MAG: PepSY-like domain-containing protein [Saprospiraceae bacterium]
MKNFSFLLMCSFFSLGLFGQKNTPSAVLEAFQKLEPKVQTPIWEYREGAFVAMFSHVDGLKKVFFNEEGEWLETRTRIAYESLPSGVKRFIDDHYAAANITYIGKVDQHDSTFYRVESELLSSVVIKLLDEQGILLKENRIDWSFIPN